MINEDTSPGPSRAIGQRCNVGCGHAARNGWVNLDLEHLSGVDAVYDLNVRCPSGATVEGLRP